MRCLDSDIIFFLQDATIDDFREYIISYFAATGIIACSDQESPNDHFMIAKVSAFDVWKFYFKPISLALLKINIEQLAKVPEITNLTIAMMHDIQFNWNDQVKIFYVGDFFRVEAFTWPLHRWLNSLSTGKRGRITPQEDLEAISRLVDGEHLADVKKQWVDDPRTISRELLDPGRTFKDIKSKFEMRVFLL